MEAVNGPVIDVDRQVDPEPALVLVVTSPGQARDGIVPMGGAFVGQRREVKPGGAGEINQSVGFGLLVKESGLRFAAFLGVSAESGGVLLPRHSDDLKRL